MSKFSKHHTRAAKLTAEMVLDMRRRYAAGASQNELAHDFDMSIVQVGRIVRGEAWRHVPNPAKALSEDELAAMARRLLEVRPDVETVTPQAETPLERMQRDVAQERTPADELEKFVDPERADDYLKEEK